jgi:hypothetical protein
MDDNLLKKISDHNERIRDSVFSILDGDIRIAEHKKVWQKLVDIADESDKFIDLIMKAQAK